MATKKNETAAKAKKGAPVKTPKKEIKKTVSPALKKTAKKKPLMVVTGEACFWVNNGPALGSLKDLAEALKTINQEQFIHHTGMGRNDFSSWVKEILHEKKCAQELLKARDAKEALAIVEKYI